MKLLLFVSILVLIDSTICVAQDPLPVLNSNWERVTRKANEVDAATVSPTRAILPEDKYFQRKAREQRTDGPLDPNTESMDARSAKMDRVIQETRTPKAEDVTGYVYTTQLRNDIGKKVKIIFWEYRFTEIANPSNVVRRQFLCGVDLKKGDKIDLSVFSTLGPSNSINTESLAKSPGKLFNEQVQINRIELADDSVLQRNDWKYAEVRAAVERVTSTPWGKEMCRVL